MKHPSTSIALLLFYSTPISGISLPISPQSLTTNTTFPAILRLNNDFINLTAPTPPPGFSTRLRFNPSVQLNPLEVYICTIELMSILANLPWNSTISFSMDLSGDEASTELVLNPVTGIEGSRLQVRYAVLGLYKAGVTIAQESNFHELDAAFYMQNEEVGWIDIGPKGDGGLSSRLVPFYSSDVNVTTTTMMANSERIIDSDDMNFALIISWDGVRVKAQDIFTAFLDGFAIAAEHNNTDIGAYIPAARSASGDMVLSTWTVGEAGNAEMNWKRMKRALIMMWDLLMIGRKGQKRSEGLVFGLEYKGVKIGAGRMLRFNKGSEGVGGSAVGK